MDIGVIYPQTELGGDPEAARRIALATEELGYGHLLIYDHVLGAPHDNRDGDMMGPYTEKDPFHDPFVMIAHLAAIAPRIEFATGVIILPQRQTVLVARQAADVDLFTGGRFRLGIGLGWNFVEYEALGIDYRSRAPRIEEQIGLLRELWSGDIIDFSGKFDRIDRAALNPPPKRQIPIWLGGFVDVALRRAARLADGFVFADGIADSFDLAEKLRGFLKDEGRFTEGFGMQINMLQVYGAEAVVDRARRWRDIGGSHVGINTMGQGLATTEQHLDYIKRIAEALDSAGLMPG